MEANNTNQEISIDIKKLWEIAKHQKKLLIAIIIICTAIATVLAFVLPKQYQSTALVRIKTTSIVPIVDLASNMGFNIGNNNSDGSSPGSYISLMQSRAILEPIIDKLDWPEEKKEKLTVADFAKSNLEFTNEKNTNLISVAAYGNTPEEAQMIAQSIVDNFLSLMTELNKRDNSTSLKFLQERMEISKKEMEEAEDKLAAYQQEKNIYSPDDQAKAIIANLSAYDSSIAQLQAQVDGDTAKLSGVKGQLEQQNADLLQYNVSDNPNVGNIREAIVNKRVEIVGLQQRYTDEHPDVIKAKQELASLESSLSREIASAVESQSVTLSPVQSNLLQEKLATETNISVGNASLAALREKESEAESQISTLSADGVEYVRLARDAKLDGEVYSQVVKFYEQARIQEAKTSMDLQVVDPADLPKEDMPAKPNKKLVVLIGFAVGIIISAGYTLYIYSRKYSL